MDVISFKEEMRNNRGKLSDMDNELECIFNNGVSELIDFALTKKLMGIDNIYRLSNLPSDKQKSYCRWLASKSWKAEIQELELKYLELSSSSSFNSQTQLEL